MFKKGLVVAVILLFTGMSINPLTVALVDLTKVTEMNGNSPPSTPIFLGPIEGFVGEAYFYTINSTDPDGDEISYTVNWDDGYTQYSINLTSGTEIEWNHTWYEKGTYTLKAKARDRHGADSDWAILELQIYDTIYVDDDNIAGPWNGTMKYPYQYIQDGIDNASDGDTVFVYNGTYYENIIVDKSVNLIGENMDTTVIDGGGSGDVVYVSADDVNITEFTVENGGFIYGVVVQNGTLVNIFADAGIEIRSNSNDIFGNIIGHKSAGGIFIKESSGNSIFQNKISNRITLFNSSDNVISNNNISNSSTGISLAYSSCNIISENNIYSNDKYGLLIYPSSNYNKIYHNNFIENVQNAYDRYSNTWDNGYPSGGNYWSDYTGEDLDGDGIGDTPYDIPEGDNQDRYPLMEPYGMTELTISTGAGLFKFSGVIKNIGNKTAFNVQWKTTIDGGIILIGRESSGYLPRPLLAGEEMSVSSGLVFGLGRIVITVSVWADNAPLVSKSIPGFLILFFIKIT